MLGLGAEKGRGKGEGVRKGEVGAGAEKGRREGWCRERGGLGQE